MSEAFSLTELSFFQFGGKDFSHEDVDHVELWKRMTEEEHQTLKEMSEDTKISDKIVESLFPNIFGNYEVGFRRHDNNELDMN